MSGKIVSQGSLTSTSAVTAYTGTTGKVANFQRAVVTNRNTAPTSITVSIVYAGASTDATRIVVNQYSIAPNDDVYIDEITGIDFNDAFKVVLQASAANVLNYLLTATEVTAS